MKYVKGASSPLVTTSLALCLALASYGCARDSDETAVQAEPQAVTNVEKQQPAQQQPRPDLEKQRKDVQQQAEKTLDKDAIAAVDETRKAAKAIDENRTKEAMEAIERATGTINVLLMRNPATALVPVQVEVQIIDAAPVDVKAIRDLASVLEKAVDEKNYPAARVLLMGLTSEMRTRSFNVPLVTYPAALTAAAKMLEQNQTQEAGRVLHTTLNTLVVIDRVIPLPLILAQAAIDEAQVQRDKDRDAASRLLTVARNELDRAKELGYSGNDPEYDALKKAIADLEPQVKAKRDTTSPFTQLKERVKAFFKRQSEMERR